MQHRVLFAYFAPCHFLLIGLGRLPSTLLPCPEFGEYYIEHVGLAALSWLGLSKILESIGLNGIQRAVALGSIIARMAAPGNELSTWRWLREKSVLGELMDVDFEGMTLMWLYRNRMMFPSWKLFSDGI